MKTKSILLPFFAIVILAFSTASAQAHGDKQKAAGPNGGRILTSPEQSAEFFITPDRKVQITFLDKSRHAVAPSGQSVTVTAGERSAPTKLTFTKSGDVLISDSTFPAGDEVPTVVQIKPSPDAKMVTEKFNVNFSKCPECKHAEYACTCDH